ncbi:hypothetical protein D9M69_561140 [compost metagenome]
MSVGAPRMMPTKPAIAAARIITSQMLRWMPLGNMAAMAGKVSVRWGEPTSAKI